MTATLTSAKINISYSILFNLTTSYSSYFGGKKGISRNKTSFFLLMNWKAQHVHTVKKGAKWAAQIQRIARSSWGITPKYARCLFVSVALPRILYVVDLWCTPVNKTHTGPKGRGPAKVTKQITTIQRATALAITGGLKTSPNDMLNSCAFLPPAVLTINKWCFRAYIRMLMLPKEHPLHRIVTCKNSRRSQQQLATQPVQASCHSKLTSPKTGKTLQKEPKMPRKKSKYSGTGLRSMVK